MHCAGPRHSLVLAAFVVLHASTMDARAAGFQILELGVKGQGLAHAGMSTRADGPETVGLDILAGRYQAPCRRFGTGQALVMTAT